MIAFNLLALIYILLIYFLRKKPGIVITFIILLSEINNIILSNLGLEVFRYLLGFSMMLIYLISYFNPKEFFKNLNNTLHSRIFIGVLLIIFGMLINLFVIGGVSSRGYFLVTKFFMPIFIFFLIAALLINNREILEQMSSGIIIFGLIFYITFYLLIDLTAITVGDRATIEETGLFNSITLSRICGMILITGVLYSFYSKASVLKIISITVSILSFYWVLVSSQRGVILAILISLTLYLLFNIKNKGSYKFYFTIVFLIGLAFTGFIDINPFGIIERFTKLREYEQMPRYLDIFRAWDIFTSNIAFGAGPGGYSKLTFVRTYPHNIFLELISEYGLFGLIGFLLIVSSSINNIFKMLRRKIFDYKVDCFMLIWIFFLISSLTSGDITANRDFWIFSGLLISVIRQAKIETQKRSFLSTL